MKTCTILIIFFIWIPQILLAFTLEKETETVIIVGNSDLPLSLEFMKDINNWKINDPKKKIIVLDMLYSKNIRKFKNLIKKVGAENLDSNIGDVPYSMRIINDKNGELKLLDIHTGHEKESFLKWIGATPLKIAVEKVIFAMEQDENITPEITNKSCVPFEDDTSKLIRIFDKSNLRKRKKEHCYNNVAYENSYSTILPWFTKNYGFDPILFNFLKINEEQKKVEFSVPNEISKNTNIRALNHVYLILREWKKYGCFKDDPNFQKLLNLVAKKYSEKIKTILPNLRDEDIIAIALFHPWYSQDWKLKASDKKTLQEVLEEPYGKANAKMMVNIYKNYKVATYYPRTSNNSPEWISGNLKFISKEFARFTNGAPKRMQDILPNLEIMYIKQEKGRGKSFYHGVLLSFGEYKSNIAKRWFMWHELGHVYDQAHPENSDYLENIYGYKYGSTYDDGILAHNSKDYSSEEDKLKSFGNFKDAFTSDLSPDDYRRNYNYELVSYQTNKGNIKWTEALRQSHYNRGPHEQIADDFAHFVMYPDRFFYEDSCVAPRTFKEFKNKFGIDYLDTYADGLKGAKSYEAHKKRAEDIKTVWARYQNLTDEQLQIETNNYFEKRKKDAKTPIK